MDKGRTAIGFSAIAHWDFGCRRRMAIITTWRRGVALAANMMMSRKMEYSSGWCLFDCGWQAGLKKIFLLLVAAKHYEQLW